MVGVATLASATNLHDFLHSRPGEHKSAWPNVNSIARSARPRGPGVWFAAPALAGRVKVAEMQPIPPMPELEAFGRGLAPRAARHRAIRSLHAALSRCEPFAPLAERVAGLEALFKFLASRRAAPPPAAAPAPASTPAVPANGQVARFQLLLGALETFPALRHRFAHVVSSVLAEGTGGGLFGRLGLPTDRGFFSETVDRISRGLLPEPVNERDLVQLLGRLFPNAAALRALEATPPELLVELSRQLSDPAAGLAPWNPLVDHLTDACSLLALRIAAVGLSDVIRARSPQVRLSASPFHRLPRAVDALLEGLRRYRESSDARHQSALQLREHIEVCHELMQQCRTVTDAVVDNLERFGVSIDVVYRLELVTRSLERLQALL